MKYFFYFNYIWYCYYNALINSISKHLKCYAN